MGCAERCLSGARGSAFVAKESTACRALHRTMRPSNCRGAPNHITPRCRGSASGREDARRRPVKFALIDVMPGSARAVHTPLHTAWRHIAVACRPDCGSPIMTTKTPSWPTPLLRLLEGALNRVLALDSAPPARCPRWRAARSPAAQTLAGAGADRRGGRAAGRQRCREPDLSVSATPGALLALAAERGGFELPAGRIDISGDADLARRVQKLVSQLDPDWDRPFAQFFGEVAGHQIAKGLRGALSLGPRHRQGDGAEQCRVPARGIARPGGTGRDGGFHRRRRPHARRCRTSGSAHRAAGAGEAMTQAQNRPVQRRDAENTERSECEQGPLCFSPRPWRLCVELLHFARGRAPGEYPLRSLR
jgi:ubiquinone biosynthesis protein UbiJ